VQVLDRAAGILQVLADARSALPPADIARKLVLHKSTLHRLLAALEQLGYIRKQPGDGRFGLGLKLFELGSHAVATLNLHSYGQPLVDDLVAETGETAHLCIMDDGHMVSVLIAESSRTVRTPATVGRRTPMHCTAVGKSMLANVSDRIRDTVLAKYPRRAYTRRTLVTRAAVMAELARVRARGYALDDEEIEEGLRCIGAPVRNHSGLVIAAVSIAGPAFRLSRKRIPALARVVIDGAARLSADLGYRPAHLPARSGPAAV
jgi:DNA-binding IclR family transcriptional regulator